MAGGADDRLAVIRHVPLPDDRELIVRPVRPGDADLLAQLYATLGPADRHRRFFSTYRPPREFFERMAAVEERGGFGLVAVVPHPSGPQEVAGEASYTPLGNGDGELAMAVAPRWRGWLGPYLLDALLAAAATRGVANLEADILATNAPMLAVARARNCVFVDRGDWSIVRVRMGTSPLGPTWPAGHDGPRVLVEGAGGRWRPEAAHAADLDVITCPGPKPGRCPALRGMPCPLAAGADAIVVRPSADASIAAALFAAHQKLHPAVPVCIDRPAAAGRVSNELLVPRGDDAGAVAFVRGIAQSVMTGRSALAAPAAGAGG